MTITAAILVVLAIAFLLLSFREQGYGREGGDQLGRGLRFYAAVFLIAAIVCWVKA